MDTFNLRSNNDSFSINSTDENELVELAIERSFDDEYDLFYVITNLSIDKVVAIIYEGHVFWR